MIFQILPRSRAGRLGASPFGKPSIRHGSARQRTRGASIDFSDPAAFARAGAGAQAGAARARDDRPARGGGAEA